MDRHADSVVAEAGEQLGWHQCSCPKGSAHCRRRGPGEGTSFGVLSRSGLRRLRGADGRAAIAVIARDPGQFVVIIAELHLPPPIGFEVLNADCDANPSVYVVMITGCASIDSPVRAAWRGLARYRGGSADESLNDPFLLRTCWPAVRPALSASRSHRSYWERGFQAIARSCTRAPLLLEMLQPDQQSGSEIGDVACHCSQSRVDGPGGSCH
jgi:ActR/RegA family two-component response regulator